METTTEITQHPDHICPVHGNIKTAYATVMFNEEPISGKLCLRCVVDKLKMAGVQEVEEIKHD